MVKVLITKQSNYPVGIAKIKKKLADFLTKSGIVSSAEVSVAIVGEKKMMEIGKQYLKDPTSPSLRGASRKPHNVLSFTPTEVKAKFIYPPDGTIHLGEIIVCFPLALTEAKEENVLIDEKVYELVEHGALHLLGIHHKE